MVVFYSAGFDGATCGSRTSPMRVCEEATKLKKELDTDWFIAVYYQSAPKLKATSKRKPLGGKVRRPVL
jgi:hypothetical protein